MSNDKIDDNLLDDEEGDNESESTDEEHKTAHQDLSVYDMIKGIVSRNRYRK